MTMNGNYEEQTRKYLEEVLTELKDIESRMLDLREKAENLRKHAQSYQQVLQHQAARSTKANAPNWKKILQGLTREDQVKVIARHNGGIIRVVQARDIIFDSGLTRAKNRSNAYTAIQNLISDMADEGIFERVDKGRYHLVEESQEPLPMP